jgi:hypothetical protein
VFFATYNQGDNDHVRTIHKGFDVPMLVFVIIGRGIAIENLQVKPDHLLGMKPVQKLKPEINRPTLAPAQA